MQYPVSLISVPDSLGGVGFSPGDPLTLSFRLRGSSSVAGDVLQQDYLGVQIAADSVTVSATPGAAGSIWHNTSAPTTAGVSALLPAPFFSICQRDVADLGFYPGILYGLVPQAFVALSSGGATAFGQYAGIITAKSLDVTPATGSRLSATVYVAVSGTGTRQLTGPVFVNFIGNIGAGGTAP